MKVLHIISGGDSGGAKTHLISLSKELVKHIDMKILCFIPGPFYVEAKELGLPVQLLDQKIRYDIRVIWKIIEIIKNGKYEIVHCHGSRANWFMLLVKLVNPMLKVTTITTVHSDYRMDFEGLSKFKYLFYTGMNAVALRFFDFYIGVSPEFKRMLIDRHYKEKKIFSVYNGIDFKENIQVMNRDEFAKKYNLEDKKHKKWVGIIARLDPVKGLDVFIKGANEILKKRKDVHFIIAGNGGQRQELENLCKEYGIEDHINFLGFTRDVNDFLKVMDINTLTSYSESFTYVLLEGARLSKPTVSAAVGGIPELIIENETGLLFESAKYKMFAEKVEKMLDDDGLASKLGEQLYKHTKQNYSVENMAHQHLDIYKEIITKKVKN